MNKLNLFHYLEKNYDHEEWLCLLHGTGGDENDLLKLASLVSSEHNLLSLRGNVIEQGMNRFFARKSMGIFDQESINEETKKLHDFMTEWQRLKKVKPSKVTYLGYSNGANMILSLALKYPKLVNKVVLMHPMLPFKPNEMNLDRLKVIVTYGENDLMIPKENSQELILVLKRLGAEVASVKLNGGHEISRDEVEAVRGFLNLT